MKIKKYIVKDMHEALKLIREELGPDAVIISNYRLPRKSLFDFFSPRLMEVTAALDDNRRTIQAAAPRLTDGGDQSARKLLQMLREFESSGKRRGPGIEAREKYGLLYGDEGRMNPNGRRTQVPFDIILKNEGNSLINREINQEWKKILTSIEINESIADNLANSLRDAMGGQGGVDESHEMVEAYLVVLKSKIARLLEPAYRQPPESRIKVFVGPAGAGKTLTMAKLAAHYKVCEKKKVALISAAHGLRPGHLETLKYYGSLIDAPVEFAESREQLVNSVDRHADKDIILVDTVGTNSRNTGMMLKLSKMIEPMGGDQDIFLVMSSSTKGADLMRTASEYQKIGYTRLIFTRLDETDTCGAILNVVCRMGVPVAFVAYGQNVPDDIAPVNPKKLAGLLLGGVDRYVEQGLQVRT